MSHGYHRANEALASVVAGGIETTYVRLGDGPTVLLLLLNEMATDTAAEDRSRGLAPLAALGRVIIPSAPPMAESGARPFGDWLAGFLEGLGVTAPIVVAPARLGPALEAFMLARPEAVARLVLLTPGMTLGQVAECVVRDFPDGVAARPR